MGKKHIVTIWFSHSHSHKKKMSQILLYVQHFFRHNHTHIKLWKKNKLFLIPRPKLILDIEFTRIVLLLITNAQISLKKKKQHSKLNSFYSAQFFLTLMAPQNVLIIWNISWKTSTGEPNHIQWIWANNLNATDF